LKETATIAAVACRCHRLTPICSASLLVFDTMAACFAFATPGTGAFQRGSASAWQFYFFFLFETPSTETRQRHPSRASLSG
jgi:hypothetical protein